MGASRGLRWASTVLEAISRPHCVHRPGGECGSDHWGDGNRATALRGDALVEQDRVFKVHTPEGHYFIDGRWEEGVVTRWLVPVLDLKCTGSSSIEDAGVELRLFRDSPQWNGVRLIGRVFDTPATGRGWAPAPGVAVIVDGPSGSVATVTDHDGIYDVSGLPPGRYSIRVPTSGPHGTCQDFREGTLESGDVWGCNLLASGRE